MKTLAVLWREPPPPCPCQQAKRRSVYEPSLRVIILDLKIYLACYYRRSRNRENAYARRILLNVHCGMSFKRLSSISKVGHSSGNWTPRLSKTSRISHIFSIVIWLGPANTCRDIPAGSLYKERPPHTGVPRLSPHATSVNDDSDRRVYTFCVYFNRESRPSCERGWY